MKKQKVYIWIIVLLIILSLSLNIYHLFFKDKDNKITGFYFLDPTISTLDLDNFLELRDKYISSYKPLKAELETILSESNGTFGIYFEDLEFHSWIGINEKEYFKPASLMKTTTVAAILKEVEEGHISLYDKTSLSEDDLNQNFGKLHEKKGETFTIRELIEFSLIYSDNTAVKALHDFMPAERWAEARLAMGLPLISIEDSEKGVELTPRQFSSVFRSLYYSGYLSRSSSNWMLSLLSQTPFDEGIPAGVPKEVIVSHKIGVWISEGESKGSVHDCGIVYANKPYILCIMSENVTSQEGNRVIEEISRIVYNYVSR